jgi:hypothetical protein
MRGAYMAVDERFFKKAIDTLKAALAKKMKEDLNKFNGYASPFPKYYSTSEEVVNLIKDHYSDNEFLVKFAEIAFNDRDGLTLEQISRINGVFDEVRPPKINLGLESDLLSDHDDPFFLPNSNVSNPPVLDPAVPSKNSENKGMNKANSQVGPDLIVNRGPPGLEPIPIDDEPNPNIVDPVSRSSSPSLPQAASVDDKGDAALLSDEGDDALLGFDLPDDLRPVDSGLPPPSRNFEPSDNSSVTQVRRDSMSSLNVEASDNPDNELLDGGDDPLLEGFDLPDELRDPFMQIAERGEKLKSGVKSLDSEDDEAKENKTKENKDYFDPDLVSAMRDFVPPVFSPSKAKHVNADISKKTKVKPVDADVKSVDADMEDGFVYNRSRRALKNPSRDVSDVSASSSAKPYIAPSFLSSSARSGSGSVVDSEFTDEKSRAEVKDPKPKPKLRAPEKKSDLYSRLRPASGKDARGYESKDIERLRISRSPSSSIASPKVSLSSAAGTPSLSASAAAASIPPNATSADRSLASKKMIEINVFQQDGLIRDRYIKAYENLKELEQSVINQADQNAVKQVDKGLKDTKTLKELFENKLTTIDMLINNAEDAITAAEKVLAEQEAKHDKTKGYVDEIQNIQHEIQRRLDKKEKYTDPINLTYHDQTGNPQAITVAKDKADLEVLRFETLRGGWSLGGGLEKFHLNESDRLQKEVKEAQKNLNDRTEELRKLNEARAWREQAQKNLAQLETELKTAQSSSPTHVRVFSKDVDEKKVNTNKAGFEAWQAEIRTSGRIGPPGSPPVAVGGSSPDPISRVERATGDENYRTVPYDAKNVSDKDTVYVEHESGKRPDGEFKNYHITVLDLSAECSDRGLLFKFLKDNYLSSIEARSGFTLDDTSRLKKEESLKKLVFTLPAVLTRDKMMEFLETQIKVGKTLDRLVINKFEDYRHKNTTEEYQRNWKKVTMPNQAVFAEAEKILSTLLTSSKSPIVYINDIHETQDQLRKAVCCLVKANEHKLRAAGREIILPEGIKNAASLDQIAVAAGDSRFSRTEWGPKGIENTAKKPVPQELVALRSFDAGDDIKNIKKLDSSRGMKP